MCYNAILPTTAKTANFNEELMDVIYIFNRWVKMLTNYGKLDEDHITDDFTAISRVIKNDAISKSIKRLVARCRDTVLKGIDCIKDVVATLTKTLKLICSAMEDGALRRIRKMNDNQGMIEKYRPLSRKLAREKIRRIDRELMYVDSESDDARTTRLVRRIVEKRAAQAVHRNSGRSAKESNRFRQTVRRATSFSLYQTSFTDYDAAKRAPGTHWKVVRHNCKGQKVLKAKHGYASYEEAVEASNRYIMNHPDDPRPMSAYKCEHCGKWHIGHEHIEIAAEIEEVFNGDEKIA